MRYIAKINDRIVRADLLNSPGNRHATDSGVKDANHAMYSLVVCIGKKTVFYFLPFFVLAAMAFFRLSCLPLFLPER